MGSPSAARCIAAPHAKRWARPRRSSHAWDPDDPTCTKQVVQAGGTVFEPAENVHIIRNEGDVPLVNVVVQLVPSGVARTISMPDPGNCSF